MRNGSRVQEITDRMLYPPSPTPTLPMLPPIKPVPTEWQPQGSTGTAVSARANFITVKVGMSRRDFWEKCSDFIDSQHSYENSEHYFVNVIVKESSFRDCIGSFTFMDGELYSVYR